MSSRNRFPPLMCFDTVVSCDCRAIAWVRFDGLKGMHTLQIMMEEGLAYECNTWCDTPLSLLETD